MVTRKVDETGRPESKRWTAINLTRNMKGESPETICEAIFATGLYSYYREVVSGFYNWAIREVYVEGYAQHPIPARQQARGPHPRETLAAGSSVNMRQNAIAIMRDNAEQPMAEVLPMIAKANGFSIGKARSYYRYVLTHGLAPGELQAGWTIFSVKYETPRSCEEAVKILRRRLGEPDSDPAVIIQLMRDLSNFAAMGQSGDSYALKMHNTCVSKKALDLMDRCASFGQWHQQTTNEHSTPISVLLKQIVDRLRAITDEEIKQLFRDNPVCTVTKEEDAKLRELGYHSSGTRQVRYEAAGIAIIESPIKPHMRWS
jgi:hypothetical protein